MKSMRWLLMMGLIVLVALNLVGWGRPSPSLVVETFLEELKKGDEGEFLSLFEHVKTPNSEELSQVDQRVYELIQSIEYEVTDQVIKTSGARVEVTVSGPDLAAELMEYQSALIKNSIQNKEQEISSELDEEIMLSCLEEVNFSKRTANLRLIKVDGKWKISESLESILYLLFNLQSGNFEG